MLKPDDTEERCGVVLKDGTIVEVPNVALVPETSYEMHPEFLIPFLDDGSIAATWHTHPVTDPMLSGEDHANFVAYPEYDHFIVGRRAGEVFVTHYKVDNGALIVCD